MRDQTDRLLGKSIKNSLSKDEGMMDLIYWEDENGQHSYYTDDLKIMA